MQNRENAYLYGLEKTAGEEFRAIIRIEVPRIVQQIEVFREYKTEINISWTLMAMSDDSALTDPEDYPLPDNCQVKLTSQEIRDILVQPEHNREAQAKLLLKHGILKLLSQVCRRR